MREEKILELFNERDLAKVENIIESSLSPYTKKMVEINPLLFKRYDDILTFLRAINKEDCRKIDEWVKAELLETNVHKNQLKMFDDEGIS